MRLLLLGIVLGLAACTPARPLARPAATVVQGVTFRVDRTTVPRGEAVALALLNGTGRMLETGVFGCDRIERREGRAWVTLEEDNDRVCIQPLYTILPGQDYEGGITLDVEPGTIRLVHRFSYAGTDRAESIASVPIRVTD